MRAARTWLVGAVVLAFCAGYMTGLLALRAEEVAGASELRPAKAALLDEAWAIVERDFSGEIPAPERVARGAAAGLLRALGDEATALIPAPEAQWLKSIEAGSEGDLGIFVHLGSDGCAEIAGLLPEGPAASAGLQPGEDLCRADAQELHGMSLYQILARMRGPVGSTAKLLVRGADGRVRWVVLERRKLSEGGGSWAVLPSGIGVLRLRRIDSGTAEWVAGALRGLAQSGAKSIVLDMRGTSGGSLEQAWRLVDEFMSSGAVAVARRADGQERSYHASEGGGWSNHPIVTVVDGGTSGAAEAIAAALQANRRSCLIGAPTYGMGSLQREFVLSDGSLARITVEVWYTAQGEILHGRGVQPEILLQPERVSGGWALTVAEAYLRRLAER